MDRYKGLVDSSFQLENTHSVQCFIRTITLNVAEKRQFSKNTSPDCKNQFKKRKKKEKKYEK